MVRKAPWAMSITISSAVPSGPGATSKHPQLPCGPGGLRLCSSSLTSYRRRASLLPAPGEAITGPWCRYPITNVLRYCVYRGNEQVRELHVVFECDRLMQVRRLSAEVLRPLITLPGLEGAPRAAAKGLTEGAAIPSSGSEASIGTPRQALRVAVCALPTLAPADVDAFSALQRG